MSTAKPFIIPKQLIWDAWKQVKANGGAGGVDDVSLSEYEEDLEGNLYKLWNRMSSGSYMPPPVKAVPIPKKSGGIRVLGVPTVSDRIAQTAVKLVLEPVLDPLFHPDSYGYRPGKSAHDAWRSRANAAGNMIGLWSSIFAGYSTTSIISYSCGQYANTAKTDGSCSTSSDGSPLRCERLMVICVNGRAELLREGSSVLSLPISSFTMRLMCG